MLWRRRGEANALREYLMLETTELVLQGDRE